jgi:sialic acid synthase SpsE
MDKVKKCLNLEATKYQPLILKSIHQDRKNMSHAPLFITLALNEIILHQCMLDYRASTNVISLQFMKQLGLKTTTPYCKNCVVDPKIEG